MAREILSMDELLARLTAALQKNEDFRDCSFDSVYKLKSPDEDGCNWSTPYLQVAILQRRALPGSAQHLELVAQRDVLENQVQDDLEHPERLAAGRL